MQEEWITGKVNLTIAGEPVEMEMTVPARPVKPQRMLPIFQQMSNAFVDLSVEFTERDGKQISCKKGCGACCSQPVPLSEVEAYQIAELVDAMPEPRRTEIRERFARGFAHFDEMGWFEKMNAFVARASHRDPDLRMEEFIDLTLEYFYEGVSCPFLEDGACSIHPVRPLACREYLVTSPAENCSRPTGATVKVIELLVKPSRALRQLAKSENTADMALITLIGALDLADRRPERFAERPGSEWAKEFISALTRQEVPADSSAIGPENPRRRRPKRRRRR